MKTNNIGKNIRSERKKRNLTIDELAKYINMTPSFLGLIERGCRGTNFNNLLKISNFFNITIDELISQDKEEENIELSDRQTKLITLNSLINSFTDSEIEMLTEIAKAIKKNNITENKKEE